MEQPINSEAIKLLSEILLFKEFDDVESADLAAMLHQKSYEKDEEICREGDGGTEMYIIAEGVVEVQKMRPHGSGQIVIARFDKGGVFGEMALIDRLPRSATIVAVQPTTVYILTIDSFETMIQHMQPLAIKFLIGIATLLSMRLRNTSGLFADVF